MYWMFLSNHLCFVTSSFDILSYPFLFVKNFFNFLSQWRFCESISMTRSVGSLLTATLILYHSVIGLSRSFLIYFKSSFNFSSRLRQLIYNIIYWSLCQESFYVFSSLFFISYSHVVTVYFSLPRHNGYRTFLFIPFFQFRTAFSSII